MRFTLKQPAATLILMGAAFALSACSTLGGVGERIGDLNPFGGDEDPNALQGDIPDASERLTILSLADQLTLADDAAAVQITLPAAYTNIDWPQAGGNAQHAMQHTEIGGSLDRVWSRSIGKGTSAKGRIVAAPVIANNVIYAIDANNRVSAMDANTGARIWDYKIEVQAVGKTRTGGTSLEEKIRRPFGLFGDSGGEDTEAIGGGLAYQGGHIYVASGFGYMLKLDAATGSEIWRKQTRTPLHSAPAVADGRVFSVSDDNEIFAFDAASGNVLWTYQGIIETARMLTSPSPAVVDDVVLAPFASGELVALRAQNGGVLWQDALSASGKLTPLSSLNDIAAGPVVADGYVFASAQSGNISAFDLRTGQRIWSQPAGALGFPWVAGEFLYIVTTDGEVVALSRNDGKVLWITQLEQYENEKKKKDRISWNGPIVASGRVITFGSNGQAAELNPLTGEIIRSFKVGDAVYVNPIIANQTIYVLTDEADLIALR